MKMIYEGEYVTFYPCHRYLLTFHNYMYSTNINKDKTRTNHT